MRLRGNSETDFWSLFQKRKFHASQAQQAWFVDRITPAIVPKIEATDQHRVIGKIDHGPWAIHLQHLALAGFP